MLSPRPGSRKARRGLAATEFLLIVPLLLIVVFGCVEICMIVVAEQRLAEASREGARIAALGGDYHDVCQTVHTTLGSDRYAKVEVIAPQLTDADGRPLSSNELPPSGTQLVVITKVKARDVVPSLLGLAGDFLAGRTIMRKE